MLLRNSYLEVPRLYDKVIELKSLFTSELEENNV